MELDVQIKHNNTKDVAEIWVLVQHNVTFGNPLMEINVLITFVLLCQ